jgi:hypothetical protein
LTADLDSEHRDTLKRIFSHPSIVDLRQMLRRAGLASAA